MRKRALVGCYLRSVACAWRLTLTPLFVKSARPAWISASVDPPSQIWIDFDSGVEWHGGCDSIDRSIVTLATADRRPLLVDDASLTWCCFCSFTPHPTPHTPHSHSTAQGHPALRPPTSHHQQAPLRAGMIRAARRSLSSSSSLVAISGKSRGRGVSAVAAAGGSSNDR